MARITTIDKASLRWKVFDQDEKELVGFFCDSIMALTMSALYVGDVETRGLGFRTSQKILEDTGFVRMGQLAIRRVSS